MEYTINKLAQLAGISTRTLRYYDEINLLKPDRLQTNGYRIYKQPQVDKLQHIMLYKELEMPLADIKKIVSDDRFDPDVALRKHLCSLLQKHSQLEKLISSVEKTITSNKGAITMKNKEKFVAFKNQLIEENETQYGREIRQKYGDATINQANKQIKNLSQAQYDQIESLTEKLNQALKLAVATNDPTSALAQRACELHQQWLCYFWANETYSKQAHLNLADLYVADDRFKAHYEAIAPSCAEFLKAALQHYCR